MTPSLGEAESDIDGRPPVPDSSVVCWPSPAAAAGTRWWVRRPATMLAKVILPDAAGLRAAGELIRAGKLVAFPTETVFGLGANAFNEEAVLDIFRVKGRPLTDPLIVHVPSATLARSLLEIDGKSLELFEHLAKELWPGPLTLVARAAPSLPSAVCAGTGYVGVRCPSHPVALSLLREANVPVAAPSANRFGHVSPTTAKHVLDDLGDSAISVVDAPGCDVGIESTVAKILDEDRTLLILRRGGVSEAALRACIAASDLDFDVAVLERGEGKPEAAADDTPQQAPGQLLTHYAPDKPTFLAVLGADPAAGGDGQPALEGVTSSVVVDFGGAMSWAKDTAAAYRDLSPAGDVREAARALFDVLRWTETCEGAKRVLVVDIIALKVQDDDAGALYDRMFRSASGRRVHIQGGAIPVGSGGAQ